MGRILITGGLGFIGKSFARRLLDQGKDVVIVDSGEYGKKDSFTRGAMVISGDVRDKSLWDRIPSCEFVYHFGAPSSIILFNENLERCVDITLNGLINAFNWSLKKGVRKVIYPSSGSIFNEAVKPCSETTLPDPINSYGKTKLACEYVARVYSDRIPSLGLRIFAGFGPGENNKGKFASVATLFLEEMKKNKSPVIYGDGSQTRDFIYIDDIVEVLSRCMDDSLNGVLNVGSGKSVSFSEIVQIINRHMNIKIKPEYINKPQNYLQNTKCDPSNLIRLLDRTPITFEEGITRYLAKGLHETKKIKNS